MRVTKRTRAGELIEASLANLGEALSLLGGVPRKEDSQNGVARIILRKTITSLRTIQALLNFNDTKEIPNPQAGAPSSQVHEGDAGPDR